MNVALHVAQWNRNTWYAIAVVSALDLMRTVLTRHRWHYKRIITQRLSVSAFRPISGHSTTGLAAWGVFAMWIRLIFDEKWDRRRSESSIKQQNKARLQKRDESSHFWPGDQTGLIRPRQGSSVAGKEKNKHRVQWEHILRSLCVWKSTTKCRSRC